MDRQRTPEVTVARPAVELVRQKESLIRVLKLKVKDLEALLARREADLKATPATATRSRLELEHLREQIKDAIEKVRVLEEERERLLPPEEVALAVVPLPGGEPRALTAIADQPRPQPLGAYERLRDALMAIYRQWETLHKLLPEELKSLSLETGVALESVVELTARQRAVLGGLAPADLAPAVSAGKAGATTTSAGAGPGAGPGAGGGAVSAVAGGSTAGAPTGAPRTGAGATGATGATGAGAGTSGPGAGTSSPVPGTSAAGTCAPGTSGATAAAGTTGGGSPTGATLGAGAPAPASAAPAAPAAGGPTGPGHAVIHTPAGGTPVSAAAGTVNAGASGAATATSAPESERLASLPTPLERCLDEAQKSAASGDILKARALFHQALRIDRLSVPATLGLARVHEIEGDYAAALGLLERFLRQAAPPAQATAMAERVQWKQRALEQFASQLKTLR